VRLVIDSNIFISSLDPKDIFHSECYPVLQLAEYYGIPLLTKDKEMKNKALKGILVLEPTDL